jgi:hypothetical protein
MQTAVEARKMAELQRLYAEERRKRLAAEQRAAGLRSAVLRMQALLARQRAAELEARAEHAA